MGSGMARTWRQFARQHFRKQPGIYRLHPDRRSGLAVEWCRQCGLDVQTTSNFHNTGTNSADVFYDADEVTFGDTYNRGTPVANFNVNLAQDVSTADDHRRFDQRLFLRRSRCDHWLRLTRQAWQQHADHEQEQHLRRRCIH